MAFEGGGAVMARPESFAIKGALLPMTLLELRNSDIAKVDEELRAKVNAAPEFFTGSPVVLSFEQLNDCARDFMNSALALCRELGFRLVGVKGDDEGLIELAAEHRLGHFPAGKLKQAGRRESVDVAPADTPPPEPTKIMAPTKTINSPIRSGQQIYSEGDLIVLAPVSAGAELLAVGNIHVYGPMRGRALAGVQGDESARIFCMSQEAELVSIAGHFMIDENLRESNWKVAAQIHFDGDQLQVEPISGLFS